MPLASRNLAQGLKGILDGSNESRDLYAKQEI
jgi:hypothetical protein